MEINKDVIQGKWNEIKGRIRKTWGDLTDDEVEQTKGDLTQLGGLVQRRYGESKEQYQEKMDSILGSFAQNQNEDETGTTSDESGKTSQ